MKKLLILVLFFLNLSLYAATPSNNHSDDISVLQAGKAWSEALASRDANKISELYDKHAILYATFSNMLTQPEEIHHYFVKLMQNEKLNVHFIRQEVRVSGNTAINSGLYIFTYEKDHRLVKVPARYTFVYAKTSDHWLIIDHHSSVLPNNK